MHVAGNDYFALRDVFAGKLSDHVFVEIPRSEDSYGTGRRPGGVQEEVNELAVSGFFGKNGGDGFGDFFAHGEAVMECFSGLGVFANDVLDDFFVLKVFSSPGGTCLKQGVAVHHEDEVVLQKEASRRDIRVVVAANEDEFPAQTLAKFDQFLPAL